MRKELFLIFLIFDVYPKIEDLGDIFDPFSANNKFPLKEYRFFDKKSYLEISKYSEILINRAKGKFLLRLERENTFNKIRDNWFTFENNEDLKNILRDKKNRCITIHFYAHDSCFKSSKKDAVDDIELKLEEEKSCWDSCVIL